MYTVRIPPPSSGLGERLFVNGFVMFVFALFMKFASFVHYHSYFPQRSVHTFS